MQMIYEINFVEQKKIKRKTKKKTFFFEKEIKWKIEKWYSLSMF